MILIENRIIPTTRMNNFCQSIVFLIEGLDSEPTKIVLHTENRKVHVLEIFLQNGFDLTI